MDSWRYRRFLYDPLALPILFSLTSSVKLTLSLSDLCENYKVKQHGYHWQCLIPWYLISCSELALDFLIRQTFLYCLSTSLITFFLCKLTPFCLWYSISTNVILLWYYPHSISFIFLLRLEVFLSKVRLIMPENWAIFSYKTASGLLLLFNS